MTKYNARRVQADGYTFDSAAEYARFRELTMLAVAGEIADLVVHPRFEVLPQFSDYVDGKRRVEKAVFYVADFSYVENGKPGIVVEDVKGVETPVFKLKAKLFRRQFPHHDLRIIKVRR